MIAGRLLPAFLLAAAPVTAPAFADRALVIGIDRYADPRLDLGGTSSAHDTAAIIDLLKGPALGYSDADIRVLADRAATRQAILDGIGSWLIAGTVRADRVFLYFSGLGYFADDQNGDEADGLDETLVPVDAVVVPGDPAAIKGAISDDELAVLLRQLDGRKVTVAIDAGTSGAVSAGANRAVGSDAGVRAVVFDGKTRSIVVEPRAKAQKAEGPSFDAQDLGPDVAVFTAASGGQAPIVDGGEGAFTKAFVDAIARQGADTSGNGIVSNAEILAFLRARSKTACAAAAACELGLTPTLAPAAAAGGSPYATSPPADKLTADRVLDYFAKGSTRDVTLEQMPPSPVKVGTTDIRFRVESAAEGSLVLLDLGDDGTLTQLFPNEYTRDGLREGHILAGSPIVVPDDYYGMHFTATSPTGGTLIALVTAEPIPLPPAVNTRKIEVIPRAEATEVYLPAIAAALATPVDAAADTATRAIDWSVATLRYEIVQ